MAKRKRSNSGVDLPPSYRRKTNPKQSKKVSSVLTKIGELEMKTLDTGFTADSTTSTNVVPLTSIQQGDSVNTRDGNKIWLKSIAIRCSMSLEDQAQPVKSRFLIVHDKQPNGTSATVTDVLTTAVVEDYTNTKNFSRFTVLMDKVVVLNQTNSIANNKQKAFFKKYIKIPEHLALSTFKDGNTAPPNTGELTLMYFSDTAAGTQDMDVNGSCRLRFQG